MFVLYVAKNYYFEITSSDAYSVNRRTILQFQKQHMVSMDSRFAADYITKCHFIFQIRSKVIGRILFTSHDINHVVAVYTYRCHL